MTRNLFIIRILGIVAILAILPMTYASAKRPTITPAMLKTLADGELRITLDSIETIVAPIDTFGISKIEHRDFKPTPELYFAMPAVFNTYKFLKPLTVAGGGPRRDPVFGSTMQWLDDELFRQQLFDAINQGYMIAHPEQVQYNYALLPEAPPRFQPEINPNKYKLHIDHVMRADAMRSANVSVDVDRRDWIHSFDASLQFSQSYISPNWYQGGNGNLNVIANVDFNVKLNQKFHPKLLCELDVFYKLGANNAPTDTIHRYNISEDNFRITGRVGYKAFKRWFYSLNMQFKTQFLNNYKPNTNQMTASFLSPGELNLGIGMTYAYASQSGRFTLDSSISPLAWNIKTCISSQLDPVSVGITDGRRYDSQLGFTSETKLTWKILPNISLSSRLYIFTDYSSLQGDLESTIDFAITRFLSTRVFAHLRYDDSTARLPDSRWHCWQFKEILSLGFTYKFVD